jgi:hypothetical protein
LVRELGCLKFYGLFAIVLDHIIRYVH